MGIVQTTDQELSMVAGATGQRLQSVPDPVVEVFSLGQELARIQRKICSGLKAAQNSFQLFQSLTIRWISTTILCQMTLQYHYDHTNVQSLVDECRSSLFITNNHRNSFNC